MTDFGKTALAVKIPIELDGVEALAINAGLGALLREGSHLTPEIQDKLRRLIMRVSLPIVEQKIYTCDEIMSMIDEELGTPFE